MSECKIKYLKSKVMSSDHTKGSAVYLSVEDKRLLLDATEDYGEGEYYYDSCPCDDCKFRREIDDKCGMRKVIAEHRRTEA